MRYKFDMMDWPYKAVIRGDWPVMSKDEIVILRDVLIGELTCELQKDSDGKDTVNRHYLRALQSAKVSAQMFWKTSGGGNNSAEAINHIKKPKVYKKTKFTKQRKPLRGFKVVEVNETTETTETTETIETESLEETSGEDEQRVQEVKEKLTMDYSTDYPTNYATNSSILFPVPPAPFWPLAEQSNYEPPFEVEDVLHLGPITKDN
jgi:hypothetical protein